MLFIKVTLSQFEMAYQETTNNIIQMYLFIFLLGLFVLYLFRVNYFKIHYLQFVYEHENNMIYVCNFVAKYI